MKKDQYIPHDVSMRSNAEVFNMVEAEGAAGYGLYWGILEYLRSQNNYQGDIRAIKGIARQLKCRIDKAIRVLENYGLFVIENTTFYSTDLIEKMQPLEKKRAQKRTTQSNESVSQNEQTLSEKSISLSANEESLSKPSCNSLEIKQSSSLSKVKESKVSSSSKEDDVVAAVPVSLAWERYVDELAKEQTWIELMAMRSGLGEGFVHRFGEVLKHFKQHIQSLGNEKDIQSPSDAKRYFCFFNTPGSVTFRKLVDELQKPVDKGKYKFEDRDPTTGERSYCGLPIPADAPPRPNSQAVWCKDKWIY